MGHFKDSAVSFHEAGNGKEAFELLSQISVDMVLMDLRMPVLNGYETITAMKQDERLQRIPVVAFTASVMGEDLEKVNQYGFDGYLRKPVSREKLFRVAAEFLPLAKPQEDEAAIGIEPVDIALQQLQADCAREVVYELKKVCTGALSRRIKFKIQFLCQPALVVANKLHVEQVLLNMLINAQHATLGNSNAAAGKGRIKLTIAEAKSSPPEELDPSQRHLCLNVEDNGIAMSAEIREQIFEKYFTTRSDEGGSGLGLAVCQDIASAHAGVIEVESDPGGRNRLPCLSAVS